MIYKLGLRSWIKMSLWNTVLKGGQFLWLPWEIRILNFIKHIMQVKKKQTSNGCLIALTLLVYHNEVLRYEFIPQQCGCVPLFRTYKYDDLCFNQ